METRDNEGHLRQLIDLFRKQRYEEAMDYLSHLKPEQQDTLGRLLSERGMEAV